MILPLLILGGAVYTAMAGPKLAMAITVVAEMAEAWKNKKKLEIWERAGVVQIDPNSDKPLRKITIPVADLPPEYSFCAGEYILTENEYFTFCKALEHCIDAVQMNVGGKAVTVDLKELIKEFKRLTALRKDKNKMSDFAV